MAHTYTVQGHIKRRDGRQEALWTRTGLTKSEAQKLAREQRAESGGVAKIVPEEGTAYGHATKAKKTPAQLEREIRQALSRSPQRSHATVKPAATETEAKTRAEQLDRQIAPTLGKTRAEIVRKINSIVRAADGRNVYLIRERLGAGQVRRVTRARTKGREMEVYLLDSGRWIGVMPELGDRIDVR